MRIFFLIIGKKDENGAKEKFDIKGKNKQFCGVFFFSVFKKSIAECGREFCFCGVSVCDYSYKEMNLMKLVFNKKGDWICEHEG